tara:strand:+ start:209 stop:754 length:546 start_codon:yes stop_codon:yes gene_type:complete
MATTLGNTIEFLRGFGFFEVVIPFLLFFALVFAILEKTKVLGTDKTNVNLIVALSVALIAIATNKVVNTVALVLPNMILMLVLFVMFITVLGLFFKESKEGYDFASQHAGWFKFIMFLIFFLTITFILNAWPSGDGTMLEQIIEAISEGSSGEVIGGIILAVVIIGAIFLVAKKPKTSGGE